MIEIHLYKNLQQGILVKRYKRFLAQVELTNKRIVTVFCPNSGSMKGCSAPGSTVMVSYMKSDKRKTRYTLEMVKSGKIWVGVNTLLTNSLAHRLIELRLIPEFCSYRLEKREVTFEDSRLDFILSGNQKKCFVEVKNVTLRDGAVAQFPDAVTIRGRKHLCSLMNAVLQGYEAYMMYVVQRSDCYTFSPAKEIDPQYAETLKQAIQKGVKVIACKLKVTPKRICFDNRILLKDIF